MFYIMIACIAIPILLIFLFNIWKDVKTLRNLPEDAEEARKDCRAGLIGSIIVLVLLFGIPAALMIFFSMAIQYM